MVSALILVGSIIAFYWYAAKIGSTGRTPRDGGCGEALLGFVFAGTFGMIVLGVVSLIVGILSGGAISLIDGWP